MAQLGAFVDRWSALDLPTPPGRWVVPGPLRAYFVSGASGPGDCSGAGGGSR